MAFALRWIGRGLLTLLALVLGTLAVFRIASLRREGYAPEQAAPANGRYLSVGDSRLFVEEQGPTGGLPVVLVHGFGAWSETWRNTTAALAEAGFHAVALDLPPFGFSERIRDGSFSRQAQARRIIGVADALGLRQIVLVGHSIGSRPVLEAALEAPGRIKALVLVDAALGFGSGGQLERNDPAWWVRALFAVRPLRNAVLSATATNPLLTKRLLSTFVANPAVLTPDRLSLYQQPLAVEDSTNRLGDWLKIVSVDPENALSSDLGNFSKLAAPTLLIWGDRDAITPIWQGEKLKQIIGNSSLAVLKGLGHIPQIEDSDRFNRALLQFVGQVQ